MKIGSDVETIKKKTNKRTRLDTTPTWWDGETVAATLGTWHLHPVFPRPRRCRCAWQQSTAKWTTRAPCRLSHGPGMCPPARTAGKSCLGPAARFLRHDQ